ncbi:MAG: 16S rRNA (cytosine(1402)-N(4))-methyltransferase RsmH [Acholeplasmataceae bacterium]|nr:16S rRNA (cytosine(1402)-N(4))-methyltransferase RsmH [Acholeplasmataceae bacterium]
MDNKEKDHQRRIRYKGTHPKSFEAKYKELNPEKYAETIEKVIEKGMTPAGMHRPICVTEILDFLTIQPGQIGLDATLGYGGHTEELLKALNGKGHLYAIDQDPVELPKTKLRLEKLGYGNEILTVNHLNFSEIDLIESVSGKLDFVIADLGVSSMQIDNPERGFSFKTSGPLDLRMNPNQGVTAASRLREMKKDEIEGMLIENADEPYASEIASAITSEFHQGRDITLTSDLYKVISNALKFLPFQTRDDEIKKSSQRTFQALRIDINHEYEVLYEFLEKLPTVLKSGGKVAILSFHSGEDRLVKKSFQHYFREGIYKEVSEGPIRPSMEEQNSNSRASSAKLRWAIKT